MQIPLTSIVIVGIFLVACGTADTVQRTSVASAAEAESRLFAVEVKVGPNWDNSKPPNEQEFFKEHASNLKDLREGGHIVMGARYSDIGLIIFSAKSAEDVSTLVSQDPSMTAGTFKYKVHSLNVFYPGLVKPGPKSPSN